MAFIVIWRAFREKFDISFRAEFDINYRNLPCYRKGLNWQPREIVDDYVSRNVTEVILQAADVN